MIRKITLVALLLATGLVTSASAQQAGNGQNGQNPPAQPPTVTAPPSGVPPIFPPGVPNPFGPGFFGGEDGMGEGPNPLADPYPKATPSGPAAKKAQSGGFPGDEDGGAPPTEEELTPQNPVQQVYDGGKVVVLVGSERHFGYRIGDVAPVTILVLVDDSVTINFDAIQRGILSANGSDFELVAPVVPRVMQKKDGKTLYRMDLQVRSFVPKKEIGFTADFQYALGLGPDGKTPDWKLVSTPQFVISTSNTADNGTDLLEGDLDQKPGRISWFTYPVLVAGLTLVLLWPALIFWAWYRRVRPPRNIPANEAAWRTFNKVLRDGKDYGFTAKHYKQIAAALRRYLNVDAATIEEVEASLKDHPQLPSILSALAKCDSVLYKGHTMDETEHKELVAELVKIVPKP